jgi:Condensation domain
MGELLAASGGGALGLATPERELPMLPSQRRYFAAAPRDPHDFTISAVATIDAPVDLAALRAALRALLGRYDSLRTEYRSGPDGWAQVERPMAAEVDLSELLRVERGSADEAEAAAELDRLRAWHRGIRIDVWPLMRLTVLDRGALPGRLLCTVHHLCCDAYSARLLLRDLTHEYQARIRGAGAAETGAEPTGIREWAEILTRFADGPDGRAEADYWTGLAWDRVVTAAPPEPAPGTPLPEWSWEISGLSREQSALLPRFAQGSALSTREILHVAAALSYREATGESALLLDSVDLGRPATLPGARMLRSVGWLTSIHPVLLDAHGATEASLVGRLTEQLRAIRLQGVGWGALRDLAGAGPVRDRITALPQAAYYLNFQGALGVARNRARLPIRLEDITDSLTPRREPYAAKLYPLMADGRLQLGLKYRTDVWSAERAAAWVGGWADRIGRLVAGA